MLDRIRRPEYTGDRRCWPCTVVNLAAVAAACAVVVVAGRPFVAIATGGVGILAIWARGYVVPWTPRFAPALAARVPVVGDRFRHAPRGTVGDVAGPPAASDGGAEGGASDEDRNDAASDDDGPPDGPDVLERLLEAGVLVSADDGLRLDADVRDRWTAEMARLRDASMDELAALIAEETAAETYVESDGVDEFVVVEGETALLDAWLTRHVAVAEVGAVRALDSTDLPTGIRLAAAGPLRTLLDRCPVCEASLEETTTVNCCGGPGGAGVDPDPVLACPECDERVATLSG